MRSLEARVNALEEHLVSGGACTADHHELLLNTLYYTSQEYLCGIDESAWQGAVPAHFELRDIPYPVRRGPGGWGPALQTFHVRGLNYLEDNVKEASMAPLFHVRGLQLFKVASTIKHVAQEPWCAISRGDGKEWLIINYLVPGTVPLQVVCLYTASKEALDVLYDLAVPPSGGASPTGGAKGEHVYAEGWKNSLKRFWNADKAYCDERFKLIPNVVEGPWPLKMAIGSKPALTGTKLEQTYFRGPGYFEVDIDIASSSVASNILSLVRDGSKRLTLDIAITIQGNSEDELPERILCQTRWMGMDFSTCGTLER